MLISGKPEIRCARAGGLTPPAPHRVAAIRFRLRAHALRRTPNPSVARVASEGGSLLRPTRCTMGPRGPWTCAARFLTVRLPTLPPKTGGERGTTPHGRNDRDRRPRHH